MSYDIHNEEDLKRYVAETEQVAEQYKEACLDYGNAKLSLDLLYVKALKAGSIKESGALEKAYTIIADESPEARADYEIYVKATMLMEGLKKVLESRSQRAITQMSLMKNRTSQGV